MRGGAQRPVLCVNEPKKTGVLSAWARTRDQNPLVYHVFVFSSCLSSIVAEHCCMLFYRHGNIKNQTDQGDETEGLEMDGLEGRRV